MRTLEEIANDYVTQDNAGTRHPIMVTMTAMVDTPNIHHEGNVTMAYHDGDVYEITTKKELMEVICDQLFDSEPYKHLTGEDRKKYKKILEHADFYSTFDVIEEFLPDFTPFTVDRERKRVSKQVFMTWTGAERHIKANSHHYYDAKPYIIYAWRNPEMWALAHVLYDAATVPHEEWNHEALRYYKNEYKKEEN